MSDIAEAGPGSEAAALLAVVLTTATCRVLESFYFSMFFTSLSFISASTGVSRLISTFSSN